MPGYSLSQLTEASYVMKVIQEYRSPSAIMSSFYGLGLTDTPGQVLPHRSGLYDIYNPTRTLPVGRAPMQGPSRVARKPVAQRPITVARFYEALDMAYEYIFRNRPLGSQYGTVDAMGQQYIARQIAFETQKFINLHEFMAVQMFRGGWALKPEGEDLYPVPKGAVGATITVDTLIGTDQQGQLPIGPGGADIIDTSWDDPDALIFDQFMELDKAHAVRHGLPIRHVWLNGTTAKWLMSNTQLRNVAGTAYVLYQSMTRRPVGEDRISDSGYDIVFTAMPMITFHVYNNVYIDGQVSENRAAQTDPANLKFHIPDGEAIFTPNAGQWCEMIHGTEPVQFNLQEKVRLASGFVTGRSFENEPPRVDLKFLFNGSPIITEFNAVYNPTVIFAPPGP